MIKVFFEVPQKNVEFVATFNNEDIYNACVPVLESEARKKDMILTESVVEEDIFFLFGGDAVGEYEKNGVKGVISEQEKSNLMYSVFKYRPETNPIELLDFAQGWDNYTTISKEEFDQL